MNPNIEIANSKVDKDPKPHPITEDAINKSIDLWKEKTKKRKVAKEDIRENKDTRENKEARKEKELRENKDTREEKVSGEEKNIREEKDTKAKEDL